MNRKFTKTSMLGKVLAD